MIRRLCLLCGLVLLALNTVHAQQKPCTDAVAQQAEDQADTQQTWDELYSYYRQFGRCFGPEVEDADAEEGTSDAIEHLLADHWDTLPRLRQILRKDPAFAQFIGLDATMDMDNVAKIKADAIHHCPLGMHEFCKRLIEDANEAIGEDEHPYWKDTPKKQL